MNLIARLRREATIYPDQPIGFLLTKAANEIERLDAECERLHGEVEILRAYIAGKVHELPPAGDSK